MPDTTGARIQEHIWLGDQPVAVISSTTGVLLYVLSDHLDTPRQLINASQKLRWAWDNADPFGNSTPNQSPQGLAAFGYNLRFPGQYYDSESGLHYNVNRDYDPKLGRYYESDPIGLMGGLNTYGYVGANPLNLIDILGLTQCDIDAAFEFAKNRNTDLIFPPMEMVHTVPGSDEHLQHPNPQFHNEIGSRAATIYLPYENRGIWINETRYGGKLNPRQAGDLLETATHEAWHWNNGETGRWYSIDNLDYSGGGRPYTEGQNRTPLKLRKEFNKFRRKCGCE